MAEVVIFAVQSFAGMLAARATRELIVTNADAVLGLATCSSPLPVCGALAQPQGHDPVDLSGALGPLREHPHGRGGAREGDRGRGRHRPAIPESTTCGSSSRRMTCRPTASRRESARSAVRGISCWWRSAMPRPSLSPPQSTSRMRQASPSRLSSCTPHLIVVADEDAASRLENLEHHRRA